MTGFRAMRLAFAAYLVPWAFIFNPGILMIGSAFKILSAFFFVTLGTVSIGIVFERFFLVRLKRWESALVLVAGVCLLYPSSLTRSAGLILWGLFLVAQIMGRWMVKRPSSYQGGPS